MMRIALALAAATLLGGQARAGEPVFASTPELVRACRVAQLPKEQWPHDDLAAEYNVAIDQATCIHYLQGYLAGVQLGGQSQQQLICFPNRMTGSQLTAVFLQWANANPQSWDQSPADAVFTAFAKAWPCQVTTGATK